MDGSSAAIFSVAIFVISIYNADGSGAEILGNGLQIYGLYVFNAATTAQKKFSIETQSGMLRV